MVTIELTKDKFGETITVTDINGSRSFAERNHTEYKYFNAYLAELGKHDTRKLVNRFADVVEVEV